MMTDRDALPTFFIGRHRSDTTLTPREVGGKAANLARLDRLGLDVPPALAIGVSTADAFTRRGMLPDGFRAQLAGALRHLEEATGLTLGHERPLLLSVRSSPRVSMPGMLQTVLNVGLTDRGVHGLIRRTGNPWLAWDAYRRLVYAFATSVHHLTTLPFDRLTAAHLARARARTLEELDPASMRDLARASADLLRMTTGSPLPDDPMAQLVAAIEAVFASWWSPRAREYRRLHALDEGPGTGVLIQAMVFGNSGARSGSGVGFTRDPDSGENRLAVDFLTNAQGEDIVGGRDPVRGCDGLRELLPDVWQRLNGAKLVLEREFLDMQDFEFTVEDGRLFFLQTRAGKRTPWAALHIAVDLVHEGIIAPAVALQRLSVYDLDRIVRRRVTPNDGQLPIGRGTPGAHGAATGAVVFDTARAVDLATKGPVLLMRTELVTEDIAGLSTAAGIVTTFGGATSHAAVVARQLGTVCIVNCAKLHVVSAARTATLGDHRLREGDILTLDGESGRIYAGAVPVTCTRPVEALARVERWRRLAVA